MGFEIMRKMLFGLLIGATAMQAAVAEDWVIEVHYADRAELSRAATHFQHVIVDRNRNVFRVDTNDRGIAAMERAGLAVTIDTAATAKLRAFQERANEAALMGNGLDSIPGFECYRTVEETYQTMDQLAADHPGIAEVDEIGPTWLNTPPNDTGYEMRAMRITNLDTADADPDRPRMVVFSSIHAREYAPAEVDTRFAEWLVNNYGSDPEATWLVDHNDFRLVLLANPDARKDAEQQIYQRKNLDTVNGPCEFQDMFSQPGVDLNRNFPFHWNILLGGGSDDDTCSQTFHGPYADGSNHNDHIQGTPEPETQNLFGYVAGTCNDEGECSGGLFADRREGPMNPPTPDDDSGAAAPSDTPGLFIDMHSNAALVLWPWGDTFDDSPNSVALRTLGRRMAYFTGYTPQQSNELYFTDGTTVDSMYGLLGVAAYTVETNGFDFFQDCASFEGDTVPTNIEGLRYAARNLHAPYLLPSGPDTITVGASPDLVAIGDPIAVLAHLDSARFNQSNGSEPLHDIASANAFVDQLPWHAGATPFALQASDGAFDSSAEDVEGEVSSAGLSSGRHLLYVQGTSDAAQAGTPNAAFVDVAAADEIGTLEGRITAQTSGDPVAATVTVSNPTTSETRTAASDGGDGTYARTMFAGTVDVRVSAPGYIAATATGLELAGGDTVTRDFQLLESCTIYFDDVESGNQGWTAQAPWVMSGNVPGNATEVWNTPHYGDSLNRALTSQTFDLTGYSDIAINFDDRCDTESGADFGYAEFSVDGTNWNSVYSCSGQTGWQSHHIELPAAANGAGALKIRFRLQSDPFVNSDGWAVDNIGIEAGGDACHAPDDTIFADGFDS
jgi:carboxypeptidase T